MKLTLLIIVLMSSTVAFSKSVTFRRLDALEAKVAALEAKVNALANKASSSSNSVSGLKVQDMQNQTMDTQTRNVSGVPAQPQISEEQRKEIQETLEGFQDAQKKQQKILDEIMNEDM